MKLDGRRQRSLKNSRFISCRPIVWLEERTCKLYPHSQPRVMGTAVVPRVGRRQEDQAGRSDDCEDGRANGENLLALAGIMRKSTLVAEPTLREERSIENDDCDRGAGNEERLKTRCADVAKVRNVLRRVHRGVLRATLCQPDNHHGKESACRNRHIDVNTRLWKQLHNRRRTYRTILLLRGRAAASTRGTIRRPCLPVD